MIINLIKKRREAEENWRKLQRDLDDKARESGDPKDELRAFHVCMYLVLRRKERRETLLFATATVIAALALVAIIAYLLG